MRQKLFKALAHVAAYHSGKMLLGVFVITIVMIGLASNLKMKTEIADMLPGDAPKVAELEAIMEDFTSTSTISILFSDEENKNKERLAEVAEEVALEIKDAFYVSVQKNLTEEQKKAQLYQHIPIMKKRYAHIEIPMDTTPLVKRIDLKMDREFIDNHGFMIQKTKDLDNSIAMFQNLALPELLANVNDNLEREYIEDSDNMASLDGEGQAVAGLEGLYKLAASIDSFIMTRDDTYASQGITQLISGDDYIYSTDNTSLLMLLQPTVGMSDFEASMELTKQLQKTVFAVQEKYPDLRIGYGGGLMMQRDETDAMAKDFGWSSVIALGLIILLLASSFRTWKTPFLAVCVLVISIIWVAGVLGVVLEFLNMMSASFGIILIGLGIDFGIHMISGFRDGRDQGMRVEEATFYMYDKVATGVLTGGLTTAVVFYALAITGFKAFSELGIAVGTGIIVTMIGMMLILPAAIAWTTSDEGDSKLVGLLSTFHLRFLVQIYAGTGSLFGKIGAWSPIQAFLKFMEFGFIAKSVHYVQKPLVAAIIVFVFIGFAIIAIPLGRNIKFEYDMTKLEPVGIISVLTSDSIISKFDLNTDFGLVLAKDLDEGRELVQKVKDAGDRFGVIGRVDGITEFLPAEGVQEENRMLLKAFREHLDTLQVVTDFTSDAQQKVVEELERLHANIVEMAELSIMGEGENSKIVRKADQIVGKKDSDSKILAIAAKVRALEDPALLGTYQSIMGDTLKTRLTSMSNPAIVTLDLLPETITERYISSEGYNLISIYPKGNIWDEKVLRKYNQVVEDRVSKRVTGMPSIMLMFMDTMAEKGSMAIIFGALAIVIFLVIDFRSLTDTILALIPLATGVLWMVGILYLMGEKFNMMSFMALPLIIGIGIDDGVHILHRYNLEGRLSLEEVMRFTGRAILLTTLTTGIGFGSMAFASHRGTASMGLLLVVGVFSCFFTSAFLLTSLITLKHAVFKKKGDTK